MALVAWILAVFGAGLAFAMDLPRLLPSGSSRLQLQQTTLSGYLVVL
jgi:hypothetical protein